MSLQWDRDAQAFERRFGSGGKLLFVAAPGRVNLMGEHTDYHDGFVLPAAVDRHVRVLGRLRDDSAVRIHSETFSSAFGFELAGSMSDSKGWARRAEGIMRLVLEGRAAPRGLDVWVDADLPVGGGLGSSAASMAAFGLLAAQANGVALDRVGLARVMQQAEHRLAGVNCGIMDQLAVLLGKRGHALLLDCRSLETRQVALPSAWALVVLDTTIRHDLASSEYNKRQVECAQVMRLLHASNPDARTLRDVRAEHLDALVRPDAVGLRRCRHVVAENERVHRTVRALEAADAKEVGELFAASHQSLRELYEVSCPELDAMVDAARKAPGCIAARMTGGGFGGCTINLVEAGRAEEFVAAALAGYRAATDRQGKAIVGPAVDGAATGTL